jgi:dipeptidyl aminopeptidase/acylaminoacyl peptidase
MVTEKFQINWGTYLSSTKDIIYAFIDGRGSANQGDAMMHKLYRNLGTVEVEDQILVAKYVLSFEIALAKYRFYDLFSNLL